MGSRKATVMSDGEQPRRRAEEIGRRLAELRQPSTGESDERNKRLAEAREHCRKAYLRAAAAHDGAAETHDRAIVGGFGNADAHRTAAAEHRRARDADLRAARAKGLSGS